MGDCRESGVLLRAEATLLRGQAREMYPSLSDRLSKVALVACGIGWGFGDHVFEVVEDLKDEFTPAED